MKGPSAGRKKAIVILNGISLKKKIFYHEYLPAISEIFEVETHETLSKNDAKSLASKFTEKYVDVIIAAGGDGTLNQVVNGMLKGREKAPKLPLIGVIPIGSGNDFVRGASLKANVDATLERFSQYKPTPVDVGVVEYSSRSGADAQTLSSYFVNVADIGMGPEVVGKVLNSGRPFGSAVAYYKSILSSFVTYRPMNVTAITPDWTWQGRLRTLAIANGKYFGHGLCIAPDAILNDRRFSVFICGNVSVLDFIIHTGKLKKGKNVLVKDVFYKSTTSLDLSSDRPCPVEADGELLGWLPAKVRMIERQLGFLI